jgi:glycosyltransferase involved in cell wall biosynthesis
MSSVVIQLGSREHYAIPVSLYHAGQLESLLTDIWVSSRESSVVKYLSASLALRRNSALPDSKVRHCTMGRLIYDARLKFRKLRPWQVILERNLWFQQWAMNEVTVSASQTIFSYSYTARLPFVAAKEQRLKCILCQIDPGPREQDIVEESSANYRHLKSLIDFPPTEYWCQWRDEIELADKIVVNSAWSANLAVEAGVAASKLVQIPLVYEPTSSSHDDFSSIPGGTCHQKTKKSSLISGRLQKRWKSERLQALFLGSLILRKGVGQLFDTIIKLKNERLDFTFAGPIGVAIPPEISSLPNVRFLGPVDQEMAVRLYRESDVFLFPPLSDGFGLTQLEALGHGLPVIASKNCALVIDDRVNGLLLNEVSPEAIAESIMELVRDRDLLAKLQANAMVPDRFHPRHLGPALLQLENQ